MRENKRSKSTRVFAYFISAYFAWVCLGTNPLAADTLRLKNGELYTNVVVIIVAGQAAVIQQNGKVKFVNVRMIRRLVMGKTRWKRKVIVKTKIKKEIKTEIKTEVRTKIVRVLDRKAMEQKVRRILREKNAARNNQQRLIRKKRREALLRSSLLPGLGQYHLGYRERGGVYMGVAGVLFLNYFRNRRTFKTSQSDYNNALGVPASPGNSTLAVNYVLITTRRDALNRSEIDLTSATWAMFLFWGWNVLEHLLFPVLEPSGGSIKGANIKVSFMPAKKGRAGLRLGFQFRF